jgi:formylglycine-generating enzyme required for sulfatase activity
MRNALIIATVVFVVCTIADAAEHAEPAGARPAEFGRYVEAVPKYFVKMEMVPVKGGKFTMAPIEKEGKAAEVEVKDLWMAKTEVPWEAFDVFRRASDLTPAELDREHRVDWKEQHRRQRPTRPSYDVGFGYGYQGYAVIGVTYHSATKYCEWLSQQTGRRYRLPTEAEFEYAAKAGREKDLVEAELLREAWVVENSVRDGETDPRPSAVGKLAANAWGLHDLLGNVAEWTIPPEGVTTPAARGGSFKSSAKRVTFAQRQPFSPRWQDRDPKDPKDHWWLTDGDMIGFRVVRERE